MRELLLDPTRSPLTQRQGLQLPDAFNVGINDDDADSDCRMPAIMLGGRTLSNPETEIFTNSCRQEFGLIYADDKH